MAEKCSVEAEDDMGFRNYSDDDDDDREVPVQRDSTGCPVAPTPATDPFRYSGAWDYAPRDGAGQ